MVSTMANNSSFIGKYRLVGELASGAFGRVYRAEDTSMNNRIVAIKLMHAAHLASAQEHNSFLQEAQFLKMLNHPYILPVLDVGIEQNIPYMVTEYAPNGSLQERLSKRSPRLLPYQEALMILAQIGQALQYAHQLNIIHRDLKPANILFNANGDAVLADFGIATMLATSMKYGTAIGTPYYMAPEQFRGSISKEGDQYSLGCIAYELLTGRVPFTAPDFFSLGYKHMTEKPMPPTQLNLLLNRTIEQAIMKAIAKQRTDRYPDIAAFLTALGISSAAPPTRQPIAPVTPISPTPLHFNQIAPPMRAASTPDHVEEGIEDEDTIIQSFHPGMLPPPPSPRSPQKEVTGQIPAIRPSSPLTTGKARLIEEAGVIPPTGTASITQSPLQPGTAFSPADTLPRVLETPQTPQIPQTPQPLTGNQSLTQPARRSLQRVEEVAAFISLQVDQQPATVHDATHSQTQLPYWTGQEGGPEDTPVPLNGTPFVGQQRNGRKQFRPRPRWLLITSVALIILLLGGTGLTLAWSHVQGKHSFSILPVVTPASATVTITPARNDLSMTYSIAAVTGKPDATLNQVQARLLSAISPTQSRTVSTTGNGTIPATHATGTLTFWNDSTSSKSFSAGMVFTDANGIQVVNDAGGTIPAGNPTTPTWMAVSVPAHVNQGGPVGNINTADINIWNTYGDGYFVVQNDSAFGGGQNAQSYTYLQNSDFANATALANSMKSTLLASTQANVNAQIGANETFINGIQCSSNVTYNHKVGDRVTSLTTTVVASCHGEVYNQQAAKDMATNLLKRKITTAPSTSYTLTNTITTTILQARISDARGTITVLVKAESIGMFQFSDAQKQELVSLILGKSEQQAQTILSNQTGISQVVISISGGNGHTLPTDPHRITITVLNGGNP